MEVDSNCLFVDVGNCDGSEIPCHDFLKPHVDTDNHSSLLDCNSKKYKLHSLEKSTISLFAEIKCFDSVPSTNSFVNLQSPSQKRFCRQSTKIFKRLLDMLTPQDDIDLVWQTIVENYKQTSQSVDTLDKNFCLVLTSLALAYNNTQHWTFSIIQIFIPDLIAYCFNVARRHVNVDDKGVVVDDTITPTIRYDDYQLEHFIELLVSPHICTDMPFGDTKLYLSIDEILLIPLIILNLAPQRIIIQYYKLL
ncbi:unnamed protein product [Rotaria sp. Silwood2]|nr:unnamed protein product [Rotaria sp. Silwood2]